jgi:SNF2 family DNA or RNA helicase
MEQSPNPPEIPQEVLDRLRELAPVPSPARKKHLDKILALPKAERELLELLSIIYTQVARTPLVQCLSKAGLQIGTTKTIPLPTIEPLLKRLMSDGLISDTRTHVRCLPAIAEVMTREAVCSGRFEAMAEAVRLQFPQIWTHYGYFQNYQECLRDFRIAIYRQDVKSIGAILNVAYRDFSSDVRRRDPLEAICLDQFDPEWFITLPLVVIIRTLENSLWQAFTNLEPSGAFAFEILMLLARHCPQQFPDLGFSCAFELTIRGRVSETAPFLERFAGSSIEGLRGFIAFLQGDDAAAIAHYEASLALIKKNSGKRKIFLFDFSGYFFILALIRSARPERLEQARGYLEIAYGRKGTPGSNVYWLLNLLVTFLQGQPAIVKQLETSRFFLQGDPFQQYLFVLILYWTGSERAADHGENLAALSRKASAAGIDWLAAEMMALHDTLADKKRELSPFFAKQGLVSMVSLIKKRTSWENALDALIGMGKRDEKVAAAPKKGSRLVWELTLHKDVVHIQPLEQKLSAAGAWSKGRNVALKRLKNEADQLDYLSLQDRNVCLAIVYERYGYYGGDNYFFDPDRALPALTGHPYLYGNASENQRLELVRGEPELQVSRKGGQVLLTLTPELPEQRNTLVVKESAGRWKVMEVTQEHRRIATVLGAGLKVPAAAEERVQAAIAALATRLTVHSDIGGDLPVESVPVDSRIVVQLRPHGAGLSIEMLVRPFGEAGPAFRPGVGGETVVAELTGKRLQTRRDLSGESAAARRVTKALPSLEFAEEDGEWVLDDPEECLELLLELKELEGDVVVFWPEGERLRVSRQIASSRLSLSIKQAKDWFAVSGELAVDDNLVLDMRQLVELAGLSKGRFLQMEDGTFLALTKEFRRRLDEVRAFSEDQGKGVRVHPLAAPALEDFLAEAGKVTVDAGWRKLLERLRSGEQLQPKIPSTFQATLRDYQTEGFAWLARLAHWGVGACLADDMGLGKTLQALALILTRAAAGPTLVVAPTSVCMNWEAETARFAPTLTVRVFGPGDREKFLDSMQPFDLVVCSYGLLQQESELLAKTRWETVVLDEAQAIKNMATQRSQAAMNLQAGFRLITTGTPLENHLGELWNLFRFINPGLLGSHRSFTERFAGPIERQQDKKARGHLKKLIRPFILRRTKNQVLEELPSRTEITYHVELGTEEMAFYEALRRQSLERIAQADDPGKKRFQILAELMKLRRACCNPRLVMPDVGLSGAKLAAFVEIVTELRDNGHKALVFSQFVDHLAILRAELDRQQIPYQYLDGSTAIKDRKRAVDAFQAGEGELFLISLKAGGAGLNLTAADYVIHMDPWWNPAVEDQASDRAHRIGQQRPVTIYRLVTRHTIEEQIVELHRTKRDLADSLLEGSDMGSRVTADDLLALLKENR